MTTSPALSRRGLLAASAAASLFLTARPSAASIGGVTFVRDAAALAGNPVYAPWPGPNGGVPPWDKVKVEHLKPALVQAMKDQLANIDRITGRDNATVTRNVRRCDNAPGSGQVQYYDVDYTYRGVTHHVQTATPPGRTITVNGNGEPRM